MQVSNGQRRLKLLRKISQTLLIMLILVACNQHKANGEQGTEQTTGQYSNTEPGTAGDNQQLFTVVNWNIEWLGSSANGPKNKGLQLDNAAKILQYLHADLYCLCEIVDPEALKTLAAGLGADFRFQISEYASGAATPDAPAYRKAQKMAYIYNAKLLTGIQTAGFISEHPRTGYYFAGGRYPYLLKGTVHMNDISEDVSFLLLHAKSGSDQSSYQRRKQAATALKLQLDNSYSDKAFMILGDFNDVLEGSITTGLPSPYEAFLTDGKYHALTLEAAAKGEKSTLDFPTVIDQQIISASMNKYYVAGSTHIRTDISKVVPDFVRGTTSDHYPVSSSFLFNATRKKRAALLTEPDHSKTVSSTEAVQPPQKEQIALFAASVQPGSIDITTKLNVRNIQFILYNQGHKKVLSVHRKYINKNDHFQLRTPKLYSGKYSLVIFSDHGKQVVKFSVD